MAELGAPPRKFNIVWFLIDALRADHTSVLGYDKPTTPYLEALSADALVFERAYSQGTATMLSVQSMLAGMDPGSMHFEKGESWLQSTTSQTLIAERLSAFGYDTLFVSGGALSTRLPSVHRGFQRVSEPRIRRHDHPDFRIGTLKTAWNDRATAPAAVYAKELVERNLARANKPFFLLVYSNDPHEPYARHGEGFPNFGSGEVARYDGEIAFVDRYVGMFTDYLRYREGLWENTIIVITSDHGEEFGEHGKRFHGATCNRQGVHVPLIVRIPGLPAKRVETPVALIDIVPTLLEAVGADAGKMQLDGQSLLVPSFAPEAVDPERPIFCTAIPLVAGDESWFFRGARTQRRTFLRDFIGTNDQLYDAQRDFAETKNLVADPAEAETIQRLGAQISASLLGNLAEIRPR
jgi:arylsulfatase A-like enzyme